MSKKTAKKESTLKSLFDAPSIQASASEQADYLELLALREKDKDVSQQDLMEITNRADDEDSEDGKSGVESDLVAENKAAETLDEHKQRVRDLGKIAYLYPYKVDEDLLAIRSDLADESKNYLYWFLLFATRLNMRDDRIHAGIDAAMLFEELSLHVALRYVGGHFDYNSEIPSRVDGLVFGTARAKLIWKDDTEPRNTFGENVDHLCKKLGEGVKFRPKDENQIITAKDDKLDIVVWRNFSDQRCGKLILFGQCKTGSNWQAEMPRLRPESFCIRWWHNMPVVMPVRMFFVSDRVPQDPYFFGSEAGILFDRCRILEYSANLPTAILDQCAKWTRAVMKAHKVSWRPKP